MVRMLVLLFFSLTTLSATAQQGTPNAPLSIIPKPVSAIPRKGTVQWGKTVMLVATSADEKNVATILHDFLKVKGITATLADKPQPGDDNVTFVTSAQSEGNEAYTLTIDAKGVTI